MLSPKILGPEAGMFGIALSSPELYIKCIFLGSRLESHDLTHWVATQPRGGGGGAVALTTRRPRAQRERHARPHSATRHARKTRSPGACDCAPGARDRTPGAIGVLCHDRDTIFGKGKKKNKILCVACF